MLGFPPSLLPIKLTLADSLKLSFFALFHFPTPLLFLLLASAPFLLLPELHCSRFIMAVGAYFPSLSEAASAISSYFGGNQRTETEGGYSDLVERSKGGAQNPKAEFPKRPRPAVERPRFAPEFDGLNCFETLVSH